MNCYRKYILFCICIYIGFLLSCDDKDIDALRRDLDRQAERLAVLEAWQTEVNNNLNVLQALINALQDGKYITSVTENGWGYSIVLSDNSVLRIYHGEKGESGAAGEVVVPVISVRDSSDGHTYWTVNGGLLTDRFGQAVRADGEKGDPGEIGDVGPSGVTPQLQIDAISEMWEISVDGGATWTSTGVKATGMQGEKGDPGKPGSPGPAGPQGSVGPSVFQENGIKVYDDYVEFVLADAVGTTFRIPRYKGWTLNFPRGTSFRMPRCVEKSIPFTLAGSGGTPSVAVLGNGGWHAEIRMDETRADSGIVLVQAPEEAGEAGVVVLLSDGLGGCWSYRLNLRALPTPRMIRVPGGSLHIIGPHGQGWRLTEYWLSETEVTCGQYCDFLNGLDPVPDRDFIAKADPQWFNVWAFVEYVSGVWEPVYRRVVGGGWKKYTDYPMEEMGWEGARLYCEWAGGCLPTEAQWEYAARGGDQNPRAMTDIYAGGNDLNEVAWWEGNHDEEGGTGTLTGGYFHPVGKKKANYLGFYDMTGNVAEFCQDYWGEEYPIRGRLPGVDPQGPETGSVRVLKGGAIIHCINSSKHWSGTGWDYVYHWELDNSRCSSEEGVGLSTCLTNGFRLAYVDR